LQVRRWNLERSATLSPKDVLQIRYRQDSRSRVIQLS
jgi:hypothetical protein